MWCLKLRTTSSSPSLDVIRVVIKWYQYASYRWIALLCAPLPCFHHRWPTEKWRCMSVTMSSCLGHRPAVIQSRWVIIQICGDGSRCICRLYLSFVETFSVWQEWDPPSLNFPRESLKPHSRPESSSKTAFLDHRDTLWMRSAGAWCVYSILFVFLSRCDYFRSIISVCLSNRRDAGLAGLLDEITNSAEEGKCASSWNIQPKGHSLVV